MTTISSFCLPVLSLLMAFSCTTPSQDYSKYITPAIEAELVEIVGTASTFDVRFLNAESAACLCLEASESAPTAQTVFSEGTLLQKPQKFTLTSLKDQTDYVFYCACRDKNKYSSVFSIRFSTKTGPGQLYPWEAVRKVNNGKAGPGNSGRFEGYRDMVLIYGGNSGRNPLKWDKDRIATHVTYTDPQGKEHWLFDAFLALDLATWLNGEYRPYGIEFGGKATDKTLWQAFIDYWFEDGYGFDALDKAVGEASQRIGPPAKKRKVVVSVPDPIIYSMWNDKNTSSTYWGKLDGREMDFTKGPDRVAACKWFIDQVRQMWYEKNYGNLELYGFYCFSEELATPKSGYNYEFKKWDQVYPELADYAHSCNESFSWIPYNWAAGTERWADFHFDFVMMQPNYEFRSDYDMNDWKKRIRQNNLSMEFELDARALDGADQDWKSFQTRFRYYFEMCKDLGLEDEVLSYYFDANAFYDLFHSKSEADKALYELVCNFVLSRQ